MGKEAEAIREFIAEELQQDPAPSPWVRAFVTLMAFFMGVGSFVWLMFLDWRIGLAVFLAMWANNIMLKGQWKDDIQELIYRALAPERRARKQAYPSTRRPGSPSRSKSNQLGHIRCLSGIGG